ncbi:hypothetical protein [Methylobacterium oryzae]|uniref:hypothetical protein n=1 Tax=Methylobacterium oryzae TaxID=334852 RepID=UPI002F32D47A
MSLFSRADLLSAVSHIQPLSSDAPDKAVFAAYGKAVTAYGAVESTFVPVGQTDTRLRDEAGVLLAAAPVKPVADIFREAVERHTEDVLGRDSDVLAWAYLDAMTPVDAIAIGLSPVHARWLRATAYAALVVYGRPGAALPRPPAGLMIDVGLVPGKAPRTRFVDEDDEEGTGVPVTVYARP